MSDDSPRILRIEDKLDKVSDHISEINITLAKQHESLEYHIRRSDANERDIRPWKMIWTAGRVIGKIILVGSLMATIIGAGVEVIEFIMKGHF